MSRAVLRSTVHPLKAVHALTDWIVQAYNLEYKADFKIPANCLLHNQNRQNGKGVTYITQIWLTWHVSGL
jgi:hypothetical protein